LKKPMEKSTKLSRASLAATQRKIANQVTAWLNGLAEKGNVRAVVPCLVTIDGVTLPGAEYLSVHHYIASMSAVVNGDKKDGEEYTERCIYVAGLLPKSYRRRRHTCFILEEAVWYMVCYWQGGEGAVHHPFGPTFIIGPWTLPEPIDYHEIKPYTRVPMTVTYFADKEEPANAQVAR
jgi:hypothetical protein